MRKLIIGLIWSCLVFNSLALPFRLVCYYTSWSRTRSEDGKFTISDIDPNLCTHLIYAFSGISDANEMIPSAPTEKWRYISFNRLKKRNPRLKTLLAVGGLENMTQKFRRMVSTKVNRQKFIKSSVTLLRSSGFDGLNLDWKFPGGAGTDQQDKQRFKLLCKELKEAFEADARDTDRPVLMLTATVAAEKSLIDAGYMVTEISNYLDFINVRTFDYHGPWENVTGHHSPLYKGSKDTGANIYSNTDYAMQYWQDQGSCTEKLNFGIAAYGRAFTLACKSAEVGAKTNGPAEEGCYTSEPGFWSYYEICLYLEGVTVQWIEDQKVPYATTEMQWVGFDNIDSINAKVSYLKSNSIGGVFVWALDLDDFKGEFCEQGRYPLIRHLHNLLIPDYPGLTSTHPTEETSTTRSLPTEHQTTTPTTTRNIPTATTAVKTPTVKSTLTPTLTLKTTPPTTATTTTSTPKIPTSNTPRTTEHTTSTMKTPIHATTNTLSPTPIQSTTPSKTATTTTSTSVSTTKTTLGTTTTQFTTEDSGDDSSTDENDNDKGSVTKDKYKSNSKSNSSSDSKEDETTAAYKPTTTSTPKMPTTDRPITTAHTTTITVETSTPTTSITLTPTPTSTTLHTTTTTTTQHATPTATHMSTATNILMTTNKSTYSEPTTETTTSAPTTTTTATPTTTTMHCPTATTEHTTTTTTLNYDDGHYDQYSDYDDYSDDSYYGPLT